MIVPYPTGLEPKDGKNQEPGNDRHLISDLNSRRLVIIRLITDTLLAALFLFLARRTGAPQFSQLTSLAIVLVLVDLSGQVLIWRKRPTFGVALVIGGFLVFLLVMSGLFAGLGLLLGLLAVTVTAASTIRSLPSRSANRLNFISIVVGLAAFLFDELLPGTPRASVPPSIQAIIPLLVAAFLAFYAVLIGRQFAQYTLRTKLVIAFLTVSLVPVSILTFLNDRSTRLAITDAANQALFAAASKTATNLDSFIQSNLDSIQTEGKIPLFRQYLTLSPSQREASGMASAVNELLETFLQKNPEHIFTYSLLNKEAVVIASTGLPVGSMPAYMDEEDWGLNNFRLVLLTDLPSVSPVKVSPDTGQASLYFTSRVSDEDGKPIGGLIAHYNAEILQTLVAQNTGLAGAGSFGVLFDEFQIHLAHGTSPETFLKSAGPLDTPELEKLISGLRLPDLPAEQLSTNLPQLDENLENAADEPFFRAGDVATGNRVNQVAVAKMETQPWLVAFFQPEDIFLGPAERQTRITLILAFVIVTLTILAALAAAQLVANPIRRLTQVAVQISEGDLKARTVVKSGDEIGTLARTFNTMTDQLQEVLKGLESQVAERTMDLNRRAGQLQTAAQVAQEAASIRDIDTLLQEVTHLISNRFGFYHCGIFLLDESGKYAILRAANSKGGVQMLARGHKLQVGVKGIVVYVAGSREPRIALDVGADAVYFDNPDLPLTRSEMALPLKVGGEVIGVLDVQSKKAAAFSEEDIEVLQLLANQIALAIDNVRHFEASKKSLEELENLYKRQVQKAWRTRLHNQSIAYHYDRLRVEPTKEPVLPGLAKDADQVNGNQTLDDERTLVTPISLRGQRVGTIILKREGHEMPWSKKERRLAEDVVRQLSLALENTRLYEETEQRADRERLIAEVTGHIRRTLDMETVLQTAAREMQAALSLHQVEIRMASHSSLVEDAKIRESRAGPDARSQTGRSGDLGSDHEN